MKLAATGPATSAARASRSVVFRGNFTELVLDVAGQPLRAQVDSDLKREEGDTLELRPRRRPHPDRGVSAMQHEPAHALPSDPARRRLHLPVSGGGDRHDLPAEHRALFAGGQVAPHRRALALLLDRTFFDSFLFSLQGRHRQRLRHACSSPIRWRCSCAASASAQRIIGSIVKVPLFVPALVAAFLILNILAFNGVLNSALIGSRHHRPAAAHAERQVRLERAGHPDLEEPAVPAADHRLGAGDDPHRHRGRRAQSRRQSAAA